MSYALPKFAYLKSMGVPAPLREAFLMLFLALILPPWLRGFGVIIYPYIQHKMSKMLFKLKCPQSGSP